MQDPGGYLRNIRPETRKSFILRESYGFFNVKEAVVRPPQFAALAASLLSR
jgi:hypothetical protein